MSTASRTVAGILHPGEMGAAVGRCLTEAGHTVLWASQGRSQETADRAAAAGLRDAGTIPAVCTSATVILSVCPPHAAQDLAREARHFSGTYLDANAISPASARKVAQILDSGGLHHGGGARYVDGGIIGPPPVSPGTTRLYLSGPGAAEVRDLFAGTALDARVIDGELTAASAVKMAYAGWTKGSAALLLAMRALARAEGVEDALLAEWEMSLPGLDAQSGRAARSAVSKGWRWTAEMEEIAATMAAAGLPAGFHQSAAEVFRQSPRPASHTGRPGSDDLAAEQILSALALAADQEKAPPRG